MKLTTSSGKTFDVNWIDGPTFTSGDVVLQMEDSRKLSEIAADFEGLENLKRESETQGNKEWNGYTVLQNISRQQDGTVLIFLNKGE